MKKNRLKSLSCILMSSMVLFTACSSSNSYYNEAMPSASSQAYSSGMAAKEMPEAMTDSAANPMSGGGEFGDYSERNSALISNYLLVPQVSNRKIVTTYSLNAETTDFDKGVQYIIGSVKNYGGYISYSSVEGNSIYGDNYRRYAEYTLKIPTEKITEFVSDINENYNITNTQVSSDDITDSYYDSSARLEALKDQEKQLQELKEKGGELEYLLEIQREISNVQYQMESLYSSLQRMDNSVNYSTVHIYLNEVRVYQETPTVQISFSQRVAMAFRKSLDNFSSNVQNSFVSFVYNLPSTISNLVILAIIILVVRFIIRKYKGLKRGEKTFSRKAPLSKESFVIKPGATKTTTTSTTTSTTDTTPEDKEQ